MTPERPAYYELGYGEDFGLTALTERLSRPGSATGPAAALGFAEELADRSEGEEAVELGEDARRLLASELSERVLHTVWLASTGNAFDSTGHGMTCRAWLERISEVSTAGLRQNKGSCTPPPVWQVTGWLTRHPIALSEDDRAGLKDVLARCPELDKAAGAVHGTGRAGDQNVVPVSDCCPAQGFQRRHPGQRQCRSILQCKCGGVRPPAAGRAGRPARPRYRGWWRSVRTSLLPGPQGGSGSGWRR
ncbi:hypothetical protein OG594_44940 [Streptomyces sp. NBC_01214]|uniref:hypothetical protein n=1 Tax=Streptomyces sp. NBC_01214 TaxID=2903777 RepID=UPI00224E16C9|nr:hypothetical protein [Streptomyces sp. NBC_01214]MCX4808645.1 hypothetical protein [Streptomyces sp. NBC_01214]